MAIDIKPHPILHSTDLSPLLLDESRRSITGARLATSMITSNRIKEAKNMTLMIHLYRIFMKKKKMTELIIIPNQPALEPVAMMLIKYKMNNPDQQIFFIFDRFM